MCVCGNDDGKNAECERCRLISYVRQFRNMLHEASSEICELQKEITRLRGVSAKVNVVAMRIEDIVDEVPFV